jgi:arginase family enzyme
MEPGRYPQNSRRTTEASRAILDRGAVPIVLGGDHAVPIPVFRVYEGHSDIHIVQIDTHIDWRHERHGMTEGLSSPMRWTSEMAWGRGMTQIGIRGAGSARRQEFRGPLELRLTDYRRRGAPRGGCRERAGTHASRTASANTSPSTPTGSTPRLRPGC